MLLKAFKSCQKLPELSEKFQKPLKASFRKLPKAIENFQKPLTASRSH